MENEQELTDALIEITDNYLFKDRVLMKVFKEVKISELEGLIIICEIIQKLKFISISSKEKYLYTELNSNNVTLTRYFDIIINYKNPFKNSNYYSPEFFSLLYFSEVENDYIERNKFLVWSLGALMHLVFSGEEPWLKHNGKFTTIFKHLYFSKNEGPYIKTQFNFSKKIENVELRILIRMCLEFNHLKRVSFEKIDNYISNYLTKIIVQDMNFESFGIKQKQRKGIFVLLKRLTYFEENTSLYDRNSSQS